MSDILLLNLAKELGIALKAKGYTLALAESCTGGLVAQTVTSISGSSAWFDRGFVTYSNQSKIEMLDISSQTLEKFGAVSEPIACEMAAGALHSSHAQITGSISGIAGPNGGTSEKPVGTVCFAWAEVLQPTTSITKHFQGNRDEIRQQAAVTLLTGLIDRLKE